MVHYIILLSKLKLKLTSYSTQSIKRTISGKDISFDMEPKLLKMQNLAEHISDCKGIKEADEEKNQPMSKEQMNLTQSTEIMEAYLKEGELNPAIVTMYKGFLRIFLAWILDESLPWTTGEAPTLQMLFKYLKVNYELPSDTTVRNQLAHIFNELHGKVVHEFAVNNLSSNMTILLIVQSLTQAVKSKIAYAMNTWMTPQMVYMFACTVACFINEDLEIIEQVIDFKLLEDKEHEGLYGGKVFVDGACKIGCFDKICVSMAHMTCCSWS